MPKRTELKREKMCRNNSCVFLFAAKPKPCKRGYRRIRGRCICKYFWLKSTWLRPNSARLQVKCGRKPEKLSDLMLFEFPNMNRHLSCNQSYVIARAFKGVLTSWKRRALYVCFISFSQIALVSLRIFTGFIQNLKPYGTSKYSPGHHRHLGEANKTNI